MRFLRSYELNKNNWDALVEEAGGNYFSFSFFLDATAKNWGAFVDENYSKGFAVCYNRVFRVNIAYPPVYGRTIDFFNLDESDLKNIPALLHPLFKIAYLQSEIPLELENQAERVYQCYDPANPMNTLSKRMLKKATENAYRVESCDFREVLPFITSVLSGKVKELHAENVSRLEQLLGSLEPEKRLLCLGIFDQRNKICGGQFFALAKEKITYILGAAEEECRNSGGMYLCMNEAISEALKQAKTLDFGGSNMDSIRRFYVALGGADHHYFAYSWDNSPAWFRFLRNLRKE